MSAGTERDGLGRREPSNDVPVILAYIVAALLALAFGVPVVARLWFAWDAWLGRVMR